MKEDIAVQDMEDEHLKRSSSSGISDVCDFYDAKGVCALVSDAATPMTAAASSAASLPGTPTSTFSVSPVPSDGVSSVAAIDGQRRSCADATGRSRGAWCTDAVIAGERSGPGVDRALKPWSAGDDDIATPTDSAILAAVPDDALAAGNNSTCEEWDQFAVNRELFGIKSTFKDDLSQYTTPLDMSRVPAWVQKQARRLAAEIENDARSAGKSLADAGSEAEEDEEALWSSVPRSAPRPNQGNRSSGRGSKQQPRKREWRPCPTPQRSGGSATVAEDEVVKDNEVVQPVGFNPVPVGANVVIFGLAKCPAYNGCYGVVHGTTSVEGAIRYRVSLSTLNGEQKEAYIKRDNMLLIEAPPRPEPL